MIVHLDSSFPKTTAWDRVRMMMFRPTLMQNIQKRPVVTWNWWTCWVERPRVVFGPHQVNLKLPPWPVRLVKMSPTSPLYLLGVSFPAPRLNKSVMAVHRSLSYQNSGCNIPLTHSQMKWKTNCQMNQGDLRRSGEGVKIRVDQLRLCVCEILIWSSCTMIRLIYVTTPVLNKSAKANNCAHDFRRRE